MIVVVRVMSATQRSFAVRLEAASPGGDDVLRACGEKDPKRMTESRSGQARISRTAAHLVVGVDGRIASTVFGTVTAMATVAAYGRAFRHSPWTVEELVLSTAVVLWIAHVYAHSLAESLSEGRPLRVGGVRRLAGRELGILLAVVPPSLALLLGAVGVLDESASIWLALAAGLVALALEGLRYARVERLGLAGTLLVVAANTALGLLVVVLKAEVLH
jgi:hypothetical protein